MGWQDHPGSSFLGTVMQLQSQSLLKALLHWMPNTFTSTYRVWVSLDSLCLHIAPHPPGPFSGGLKFSLGSVQFSSVDQSCLTLCDPMNHSTPSLPVHNQLLGLTQTHVHWVSDAIQPSHPLLSPSPPALNLSQHKGLFKLVSSLHQVAKVLEFQLQHQSFQWTPKTDLL